ncbi:MAG: methyltransferase domain-containing protein, partial [Armatimonadetes bacterium]|nr:methyltransferase domain-containing protein [Armatimonadota bacterium]NIN06122.1 methyltransferase domain-containing protein [Armatimonadota bacterium]NIO56796.1 methyltransferase domain-containing protein [Candidatus Latescibacterota bacterium]NIT31442.1 methyltransferase domain-containing protein [Armatimonadota bacterium]
MTNDPLELSFDIYQRYRAVATLLEQSAKALGLEGARLLDVGSGHENYLGMFLPRFDIWNMDSREPPEGMAPPNFVLGDALALPFEDKSFDFSCSVDALEHIQPEDRPRAIDELIRVSRGPVIIACPCGEDDVEEYEALANSYCASVFGSGYTWLEEHQEAPLPNASDIASHAEKTDGIKALVLPNGYLPRWVEMITLQLLASHVSSLKEYWGNACRLYNKQIYPYDNKAPCYRRVVVLTRDELPLSLPAETEDKQFRIRYEILRNAISQRLVAGGTVGIEQHYQSQLEQLRGEARKLQRQVDIQASQLWEASGRERHKSAKIVRLEKDVKILQERLTWEAQQIRASATWRVGRLVLMPLLFARKALGAMKSRFAGPAYTKQDSLLVQFTPPDPENPYYVITGEHLRKRGWDFQFDNDPGSILA